MYSMNRKDYGIPNTTQRSRVKTHTATNSRSNGGFQEGVDYARKILTNKTMNVAFYSSESNQEKAEWFSKFKEGDILAATVDIDDELVITIFRGLDGGTRLRLRFSLYGI